MYGSNSRDKELQKNDTRKILLQMLITSQNALNLSKQLPIKVPLSNITESSINIDSSGIATTAQTSKKISSSSSTPKDRNYNDLLVNTFLQEMISYPLTYPNLLSDLKHNADNKLVVTNEARKVVGESLFIPIVNVLMKAIDDLASLSDDQEDSLVKDLMNNGRGQSSTKDVKALIKSGSLEDIYEELSKLTDDRSVDVGTLDSIRKTWINIFSSGKDGTMFIDLITMVLPTIESRIEGSKCTPSMEDPRVIEFPKVTQFIENALSERVLKDLDMLAKSPYPNTLLAFFRNSTMQQDSDANSQAGLTNLYYIMWWALTKDSLLSTLYLRSVDGKPPEGVKPELMFQGSLFQNSQNKNAGPISQTNSKYFQEFNNNLIEEIKKPGGLRAVINSLLGVSS